jgi:hypothetical protein
MATEKTDPLMPTLREELRDKHIVAIDVAGPFEPTERGNR